MWSYQHTVETTAAPAAVWELWADVANWGAWNADITSITIDGPFAEGSLITMVPGGQDAVELRLSEVVEHQHFADQAEFGTLVLRTSHRLAPGEDGRTLVTYRLEITGEGADQAGPEVGPMVSGDWPETMAALVELAEQGGGR
ncbi:SRPBCC family protein [Kitasatospora sp. NPDC006697]|uniref:SRPBCC family protein n=1 Tax=Kitasatospora sp. NPDC006697 TaxID=3364020 RepID=UPI003681803D